MPLLQSGVRESGLYELTQLCQLMVLSRPFSPTGMCNASMGEVLEVWRSRRFIYLLAVTDGAGEKV